MTTEFEIGHFHNGVCTGCSIVLSKKRKDPTTTSTVVESYDPERKTGLRPVNTCYCKIFSVTKLNRLDFLLASRENKRKRGRPTTKIIANNVKTCANCFTKIYRGRSHSASQCQYSRCVQVANLMEISSPTIIQRAAFHEQYLSEIPVTPLGQPEKVEEVKK